MTESKLSDHERRLESELRNAAGESRPAFSDALHARVMQAIAEESVSEPQSDDTLLPPVTSRRRGLMTYLFAAASVAVCNCTRGTVTC